MPECLLEMHRGCDDLQLAIRCIVDCPGATLSGSVTVGDRTHIGTAAAVIQGISIGCDCLVAAGAVVYRNLADTDRLIKQR
jgi:acetyltransferase-like isoleucine patch superfamily enzyme